MTGLPLNRPFCAQRKLLCSAWMLGLSMCLPGCVSVAPASYDSGVLAAANKEVRGTIIFRIFRTEAPETKRIGRCYVQHGFGAPNELVVRSAFRYDSFVNAYYGPEFVQALLESSCGEVIVAVQESIDTSILEMTQRTERFLRDSVCNNPALPGQIGCAYIGHSKGGAVAYNVARRCMQRTSEMGEEPCGRLGEVFSAAGVVQGALLTFTALGAYAEQRRGMQSDFTKVLGGAIHAALNVYQEYVPGKTNPVWMDLSPAAPLENGMPIYSANEVVLRRAGWFRGDFASLSSDFDFETEKRPISGCGEGWSLFEFGCRRFGSYSYVIHEKELSATFERGVSEMQSRPETSAFMKMHADVFTWANQQKSDGLADFLLANSSCKKGLLVQGAERSVQRCAVITDLNHWASAGGGQEARKVILEELSR